MYRVRIYLFYFFFFSSRRRHTRCSRDWSSDVCSSDLFQDYLKYYGKTDLASNAQFYVGEIAYKQRNYQQAIAEYDKVLSNYPKSFKMAPALLQDRKSTRLNSSHGYISYAVFCLKKKHQVTT